MLININYAFVFLQIRCSNLVTWKDLFEKINAELDLTKRKKQALESLRDSGRVSQFVYECLNKGLDEEIEQTDARRKALAEKMTSRLNELEEQRIALEMFLANDEMAYVAGEINEEIHSKESGALDLGLEATRQELSWIKEVIVQLVPKESEASACQTGPEPAEAAESTTTEAVIEKTAEAAPAVSVEVPVEVTASISEVKVGQIQPPADTPATTSQTTNDE
jgi:hypothetical protein